MVGGWLGGACIRFFGSVGVGDAFFAIKSERGAGARVVVQLFGRGWCILFFVQVAQMRGAGS